MASAAAPAPEPLQVPRWLFWIFVAAIAFTYFGTLPHYPLAEPDEGRYGEIAREMVELGDWVTPHLNYVKYFEKPPLIYWLTAINFTLFGSSELVVRLWPALFATLGIVVVYTLGRAMYDAWTGAAAAALLAAAPLYFGLSQFVILDMPLTALMAAAIGSFWFAYQSPRHRRSFVLLLYATTALAVLTKGPVAVVLTGGVIVAFLVLQRDLAALRWAVSPLGILLFVAIALPWFVLVSARNPEFVEFFVIKQHVSRYLTPDEHRQPLWFFVPIVFGGMVPWSVFVVLAPRMSLQFLGQLVRRQVSAPTLYCLLWAAVVFAFFSASGSKLGTYILPMFCPLAILAARFFRQVLVNHQRSLFGRACGVLMVFAALILVAALLTPLVNDDWRVVGILPKVYAGALVLGVTGGVARTCASRRRLPAGFAVLLLGTLALQVVAVAGRSAASQFRPLGEALRRQAGPQDLVIMYRHYTQGISFYSRRRAVMVGDWGELDFGSQQGDQSAFFWRRDSQLLDAWRSGRHVFLVINRSELEPLRTSLQPPPRQIAAHGKKVLIVNFQ